MKAEIQLSDLTCFRVKAFYPSGRARIKRIILTIHLSPAEMDNTKEDFAKSAHRSLDRNHMGGMQASKYFGDSMVFALALDANTTIYVELAGEKLIIGSEIYELPPSRES